MIVSPRLGYLGSYFLKKKYNMAKRAHCIYIAVGVIYGTYLFKEDSEF